jgi:hypothetical protein
MKMRIFAAAFAIATALSIATPAAAGTVPIDYTILTAPGDPAPIPPGIPIATMVLDYDGSTYSLVSLALVVPLKNGESNIDTSQVTFAPVSGTSDYCIYTLSSCSTVAEKGSLSFIFDPSLETQISTLNYYEDSTTSQSFESGPFTIAMLPEPATWAMMLLGLGAIGFAVRRREFARALAA